MFRNLMLYRIQPTNPLPEGLVDGLDLQLSRGPFVECPSNQPVSRGWGKIDGMFLYPVGRFWFARLDVEERLLPARAVNLEVSKRADALEEQQGYRPGRKQMRELRERVTEELLPRALVVRRSTNVWFDPVGGWLGIDAASPARADEVLENLRYCLDSFPLSLVHTALSPTSAMADWLASGEAPEGFTVDRDCELKAVGEEKAAVRYKRHPLEGDEIKGHLAGGKLPTCLALTWDDRLSFVLTDRLEVKRLHLLDVAMEQARHDGQQAGTLQEEQADADRAIMSGEFARFIPALLGALGGEVQNVQE